MNTIEIICALIGAIAIILGGVWFIIGRAFDKGVDKHRLDSIEYKVHGADCTGHKNCIDSTDRAVRQVNGDLVEIKRDLSIIKAYLIGESDKAANIFSMKNSPRKLNSAGENLFKDINGDAFLSKHEDFLFGKIDAKKPTSALDVEIYAKQACVELVDDPMFKGLKDFVYNSPSIKIDNDNGGTRSHDITLNDICFVISLPLRDRYLDKHPGIKTEE